MHQLIRSRCSVMLALFATAGCADYPMPTAARSATPTMSLEAVGTATGRHIVMFAGREVPADFPARVAGRGGAVDAVLAGPGLAIVSGLSAAAAADLAGTAGIDAVAEDRATGPDAFEEEPGFAALAPTFASAVEDGSSGASGDALSDGSDGTFPERDGLPDRAANFAYQWNLRAIKAQAAWHAGHLGSPEVRVYLLDTGIDYTRPDLVGRVDTSRSRSFVPKPRTRVDSLNDEVPTAAREGVHVTMDFHSHGTAVATTIVSNGVDFAGVSMRTTLVAVKVVNRSRSVSPAAFIAGITYAADDGADIIHLSLPYQFLRASDPATILAVDRVTSYAHERGVVLVAAAGNNGADLDKDFWRPCNAVHVICVSATGPTRAVSPTRQLHVDELASYTNFGKNTITVAGPGGTDAQHLRVRVSCSRYSLVTTGNPAPCSSGARWFETTGTTYGAAATTGLAALILSDVDAGRENLPDFVRSVLMASANDLGAPGHDAYYGAGRINVARAMAMLRGTDVLP
jgi:lantibiotic leader peptide-processing serine protease